MTLITLFCEAASRWRQTCVDNSNCLECHADPRPGSTFQAAVKLGCNSCHRIESREDASYVVLKPAQSLTCFECHQAATPLYPHLPYPYLRDVYAVPRSAVSPNPWLLRAKVSELCLKGHMRTPESVPSCYMPTIALTFDNRMGHPYERHPVSGRPDPLTGGEISCISCHLAHGGTKAHDLKMASEIPEDALNQNTETNDMCRKVPSRLCAGLDGVAGRKKNKKRK